MAVFGTANIKGNPLMTLDKVEEDLRRIINSLDGKAGAVGLQEMWDPGYRGVLLKVAEELGWGVDHEETANPIIWDKRYFEYYPAGGHGVAQLHEGKAAVTPHRTYTWIALRRIGTNRVFIFVNTHYVSGAWTTAFRSFQAWRKAMWEQSWDREDAFVDSLVAKGFLVVLTGDFNKTTVEKFDEGQIDLIDGTGGIIHLALINGKFVKGAPVGPVITINGTQNGGPLNTDHPVKFREVDLSRLGEDKPDAPAPLPAPVELTRDQKIAAWRVKNKVSPVALVELLQIIGS
jgi:hypothetical protein